MGRQVVKTETYGGELADLRAFASVVDLGSITAAARTLGETKGSVSRRVRRVEQSLGVELFRRSPRTVAPTEDGLQFRLRIQRALDLLNVAVAEVQHRGSVPSGNLRVTAPFDLAIHVFAPLIAELTQRHPDLSVELLMTSAVLDFEKDQIDVALRAATSLPDSTLIAHRLSDASSALYASAAYLQKHRAPRRPADLDSHALVVVHGQRGRATLTLRRDADGQEDRRSLRASITSSDFTFSRVVAVLGAGIAVLPLLLGEPEVRRGELVRVLPAWSVRHAELFLVYPAARFLAPKVRVFRDLLLESFGKKLPR